MIVISGVCLRGRGGAALNSLVLVWVRGDSSVKRYAVLGVGDSFRIWVFSVVDGRRAQILRFGFREMELKI